VDSQFSDKAAIVGIGQTEFSKNSGRSELRLAVEAVSKAVADAGLEPADIDGLSTISMDTNAEIDVARALGMGDVSFFSRVHYGGGAACGIVHQAVMAVVTGTAKNVVVYRAFNERSGRRFGTSKRGQPTGTDTEQIASSWLNPFGLTTPASKVAMFARRYMHEYGATSEDFGRISVVDRKHAANNPRAWFYQRPITLEDHQNSPLVADPIRLLDCCQESDAGVALVVTSTERARDLPNVVVSVSGAAQGLSAGQYSMASYYRPTEQFVALPEMSLIARQLYATSQLTPDDIHGAIIYDHFTPLVLPQLEAFGFCGRGEAKDFIRDGNLEIGGRLPFNTHGGQLGEAYVHGVNGITEAVRQLRGESCNPIADAHHLMVTAGTSVPTSGLILSNDR
jgi:acetyl-CoA acetyltransferase